MEREIGLIASGPSRYFSSPLLLFIDTCMCTYVSFSLSHTVEICMRVYIYTPIFTSLLFIPVLCRRIYIYVFLSYSFAPNTGIYVSLLLVYSESHIYLAFSLSLSLSFSLVGSFCISERAIALAMGMNRWLDCDPRR